MRRRKRRIPENRVFFGTKIIRTVFIWLIIVGVVLWADPEILKNVLLKGFYLPMGVLLWIGFFSFLNLFFGKRSCFLWSSGVIVFLYLRLWGVGNWLNGILLLGVFVSIEAYIKQKENV